MIRCGKSCCGFSTVKLESLTAVDVKETVAWPDGLAVYTSFPPSALRVSCSYSRTLPPATVRLDPSIIPPAGAIHISRLSRFPVRCSQHPASQAGGSGALAPCARTAAEPSSEVAIIVHARMGTPDRG